MDQYKNGNSRGATIQRLREQTPSPSLWNIENAECSCLTFHEGKPFFFIHYCLPIIHKKYTVTTAHRVRLECIRDMRKGVEKSCSQSLSVIVSKFKKKHAIQKKHGRNGVFFYLSKMCVSVKETTYPIKVWKNNWNAGTWIVLSIQDYCTIKNLKQIKIQRSLFFLFLSGGSDSWSASTTFSGKAVFFVCFVSRNLKTTRDREKECNSHVIYRIPSERKKRDRWVWRVGKR